MLTTNSLLPLYLILAFLLFLMAGFAVLYWLARKLERCPIEDYVKPDLYLKRALGMLRVLVYVFAGSVMAICLAYSLGLVS